MYGWCCVCGFFFLFKQKTAYEMRISDWSSDVCSSDLTAELHAADWSGRRHGRIDAGGNAGRGPGGRRDDRRTARRLRAQLRDHEQGSPCGAAVRSEEHTSELQSLMRISYAVFCLKKKKKKHKNTTELIINTNNNDIR